MCATVCLRIRDYLHLTCHVKFLKQLKVGVACNRLTHASIRPVDDGRLACMSRVNLIAANCTCLCFSDQSKSKALSPAVRSPGAAASRAGGGSKRGGGAAPTAAAAAAGASALAEQQAQEISRLEALCESRTKQLNYAKLQLKQSAAGFQAMSVLVDYMAHDVSTRYLIPGDYILHDTINIPYLTLTPLPRERGTT